MQVNLDEVVSYLRELLYMNKAQLLGELGTMPDGFRNKVKKSELIAFVLEKKFNPKVRVPGIAGQLGFVSGANLAFGKRTEP